MSAPALQQYQQGISIPSADNYNTFDQTCDTLSQLRAFIGTTGMQVYTRGQSAVDDGYQGAFYWSANLTGATDDNVNTIIPNGVSVGGWVRVSLDGTSPQGKTSLVVTSTSGNPTTPTVGNYAGQVAIGNGATVSGSGVNAVALGNSYASGGGAFAAIINDHSGTYGALVPDSIAIGNLATVSSGNSGIAIGNQATVNGSGTGGVAIGSGAVVSGTANNTIALGNSFATGEGSVAIGNEDHSGTYGAQGANSVALWNLAKAAGAGSVAIGVNSVAGTSSNGYATVLGGSSNTATGLYAVARGQYALAPNYGQDALGGASTSLTASGGAQASTYILSTTTTSTAPVYVWADGAGASQLISVSSGQAVSYRVSCVAHDRTTPANNGTVYSTTNGLLYNNAGTLASAAPVSNRS